MASRSFSEYADRNAAPILGVLRTELKHCSTLLEIGSGTGQHAALFARELPHLQWQTSDLDENHEGINAWTQNAGLTNLLAPILLNVLFDEVEAVSCDAIYSANTTHIMSIPAVRKMFEILGTALTDSGVFCLYGPFRQDGAFNAPSNANFHDSLRSRDPEMGIRHLEFLDELGKAQDLLRQRLYAMPANNYLAVWRKDRK